MALSLDDLLAQVDAHDKAMFKGPWRAHTFEIDCPCPNGNHCGNPHTCEEVEAPEEYPSPPGQCVVQIDVPGLDTFAKANAEGIAWMRNALPELAAHVRRMQPLIEYVQHDASCNIGTDGRGCSCGLDPLLEACLEGAPTESGAADDR
jgi:hypothetical protein